VNNKYHLIISFLQEEFEDTNGVIRISIWSRTDNTTAKRKKYKRINNDQQIIHIQF